MSRLNPDIEYNGDQYVPNVPKQPEPKDNTTGLREKLFVPKSKITQIERLHKIEKILTDYLNLPEEKRKAIPFPPELGELKRMQEKTELSSIHKQLLERFIPLEQTNKEFTDRLRVPKEKITEMTDKIKKMDTEKSVNLTELKNSVRMIQSEKDEATKLNALDTLAKTLGELSLEKIAQITGEFSEERPKASGFFKRLFGGKLQSEQEIFQEAFNQAQSLDYFRKRPDILKQADRELNTNSNAHSVRL